MSTRAIDVHAATKLPEAVRAAEVLLDTHVERQLCMPGHLLALVVRQRLTHWFGNAAQFGSDAFNRRSCGGVRYFLWQHHARAALHHDANCIALTRPLNKLDPQVPGKLPVVCLRRTNMDAQYIGRLAPAPALFTTQAVHAIGLGTAHAGK